MHGGGPPVGSTERAVGSPGHRRPEIAHPEGTQCHSGPFRSSPVRHLSNRIFVHYAGVDDMATAERWPLRHDGRVTELPYIRQPVDFSSPTRYAHSPDSERQPRVPIGALEEHRLEKCRAYPGTERSYWVYVPQQYSESRPASLMV